MTSTHTSEVGNEIGVLWENDMELEGRDRADKKGQNTLT